MTPLTRAAAVAAAAGMLIAAGFAEAAAPTADSIFPAGGRRGTSVAVTATPAAVPGKFDTWPVGTWTDSAAIKIEPGKTPGALTFHIAKDAAIGPHLFRLHSPDGASPLRCFMVGEQPEMPEAEPNDDASAPQIVGPLPVTINGQLDKSGDVECFAVKLDAGQTLVAAVQARRLGAMIDPMLHLFAPGGAQVAFAHDGLGLDPLLAWRADKAGTYVVRLSAFAHPPAAEVKLAGGKNAAYRMSLTTGPFARGTFPLGVPRGKQSAVRAVGWNLAGENIEVDATDVPAGVDALRVPVPGAESPLKVDVFDGAQVIAAGAARADAPPSSFTPPAALDGVIGAPGGEDRYAFTARKGERYAFAVRAAAAGSPLEPLLVLRDPAGKPLASAGESGVPGDPKLEWTATADGPVHVAVSDLFHKGGPDFLYRVRVGGPAPEIGAAADADVFALAPGKSTAIKLTVTRRNGHAGNMLAVVVGLPPGVTATSPAVPVKGGDVTITLTAAADAKPASGPVQVCLVAANPLQQEIARATYDLTKDVDKAGGQSYFDRTQDLWLTLSATASTEKPKPK